MGRGIVELVEDCRVHTEGGNSLGWLVRSLEWVRVESGEE